MGKTVDVSYGGENGFNQAIELSAIETLIVYENLPTMRYTLKNAQSGEETVLHLSPEQEADQSNFVASDGAELEVIEKLQLVEWFANNYKNFGATLEFVTNRSQEGSQFVKGFGGIGGILRYKVDFMEDDFDDDDDPY